MLKMYNYLLCCLIRVSLSLLLLAVGRLATEVHGVGFYLQSTPYFSWLIYSLQCSTTTTLGYIIRLYRALFIMHIYFVTESEDHGKPFFILLHVVIK